MVAATPTRLVRRAAAPPRMRIVAADLSDAAGRGVIGGRQRPQKTGRSLRYGHVVDALAKGVAERLAKDRTLDVAGLVINTSSWVDGDGFQALLRAASAFAVDAVLVLAHDRLFADLRQALPRSVAVAKLPRSGGIVLCGYLETRQDV